MVSVRVPNTTRDYLYAEHYPLRLENDLRKYLLAGEAQRASQCAEEYLDQLKAAYSGKLGGLKPSLMQAIVVLYHKASQIGVPVERSISQIIPLAQQVELIETWEELRQIFDGVVTQILEKTNQTSDDQEEFCYKVKSYIKAHFHKDVTLGDLAQAMRLEPVQLSRMFARKMGCDFRDYLAQRRVKEAKKLLLGTALSVAEVAVMVGYHDVAYFIRVFKRLEGTTPRQFAKQNRKSTPDQSDVAAAIACADLNRRSVRARLQSRSENISADAYPWREERNLSGALLSGGVEELGQATEDFFGALMDWTHDVCILKSYVIKVFVVLARKCLQNGIPVEDCLFGTINRCRLVDQLETSAEIRGFLDDSVQELHRRVVLQKHETIRAVESLKNYIQTNYNQPIKLEELAELVNYSPYYLVRVFGKLTGATPHEYLINTRIEAARELALRRKLSTEEIADLVGYQDTSHFVLTFKKKYGQTPKEYAEQKA